MKIHRMTALAALVAAICLFPWPAFSQTQPVEYAASDLANARVRRLIGMSVENRDGARLGAIRDFIVDFHTGRINYALLSTAGILGLRAQLTVVPVQALSTATVKQRTLALDISKARWNDAPRFHKKELQLLAERTREVQLLEFYGLAVPARDASRPKGQLQFATAVMGARLIGRDGASLGKISGLLLDLAEKCPAMAVVTAEPLAKKQTYALPLKSLEWVAADKFKLDATLGIFGQARMLTPKSWQSAGADGNRVYRYE